MWTKQDDTPVGNAEHFQTLVIGGGQAGLAVAQFLARAGEEFLILDENPRTGDSWRSRWDSLQLFTPSQFDSLPGMPFPAPQGTFPTKDEVADYLETYARRFRLPIRRQVKVETLRRNGGNYLIRGSGAAFTARNVIVATGPTQRPRIPAFAAELDPQIVQLHSSAFRNPRQMTPHAVLVVGAGNSGAEIALELLKDGKQVWLAGRDVGRLPIDSRLAKVGGGGLAWWFMTHLLTVDTPLGRGMRTRLLLHGAPLGRARRAEVARAGVVLTPRMSGTQSGKPQLEDGRILPADGILWATGFQSDYHWIQLPILDARGFPIHSRGVVPGAPGLYFLGLTFQTGLTSALLGGVGKDAADIAAHVVHNRRPPT